MLFRQSVFGLLLALSATTTGRYVRRQDNSTATPTNSTGTHNACASAASLYASAVAVDPSATPTIQPSLALACLESVPVDVERDVALIDYLVPYLELQSTQGYLKDPPEGYLLPGFDIMKGMQEIRHKLLTGGYSSQYEWAWELQNIFVYPADGHFAYIPGLLGIFIFRREPLLVSISSDGLELPKLYDGDDFVPGVHRNYTPSDIVSIDGRPMEDYLLEIASSSRQQDPDSQYNTLFDSIPNFVSGLGHKFRGAGLTYKSLPDESVYEFSNGTTQTRKNIATIRGDLTGIASADDLHNAFEVPLSTDAASTTSTAAAASSTATIPASASSKNTSTPLQPGSQSYPPPIVSNADGYMKGFFLDDPKHRDTAVLALTGFLPADSKTAHEAQLHDFRKTLRKFLNACQASNKTKLVIDLQANGGGLVMEAFELYRSLLPNAPFWDAARIRATDAFDYMGNIFWEHGNPAEFIGNLVDENNQAFPDFPTLFGPYNTGKDNETAILRVNFTAPDATLEDGFWITGFGPPGDSDSALPPQVFDAKNIIIATDGICASTCTTFVGLMTRQGGVRTVALGGRPIEAPMQAMGGVKGRQDYSWKTLSLFLNASVSADNGRGGSFGTALPSLDPAPLLPLLTEERAGSFNFKNAYSERDTATPLQFVYEAANCKAFYTADMVVSITATWTAVADIAFRGAKCVAGSTVNADGTIGDVPPALDWNLVASTAPPYTGPGSIAWKAPTGNNSTGNGTIVLRRRAARPASVLKRTRVPKGPTRRSWW